MEIDLVRKEKQELEKRLHEMIANELQQFYGKTGIAVNRVTVLMLSVGLWENWVIDIMLNG